MTTTQDIIAAVAAIDPAALPTREEAISLLVEWDVARWGEAERAASGRARSRLSHGLALNSLIHVAAGMDVYIPPAVVKAGKRMMTPSDVAALRKGG